MQAQFGFATGGGVGDDADEGSGLQIETWPRPEGAEYRFGRHIDELLHDRVAVDLPSRPFDRRVTQKLPTQRRPFPIKLAFRHHPLPERPAILPFQSIRVMSALASESDRLLRSSEMT